MTLPVVVGWSLTGVTVKFTVSVAVENAVLPSVLLAGTLRSAVLPLVPLLWSQARIVSAEVMLPCQLALGLK